MYVDGGSWVEVVTCGSNEGYVEPECESVHSSGLEDVELVRDVDAMQVRFVGLREVDDVALGLGKANPDVESVNLNNGNGC